MAERSPRIVVAYHSAKGHTAVVAHSVAEGATEVGAEVELLDVASMDAGDWRLLADADAIVFGCPTHMGSVSAPFKAFMDASSRRAWVTQAWKDKLAAGFTNSSGLSGDKLNTLVQLSVFAAQHSMVWVSLGLMPGNRLPGAERSPLNRLGSHLGAMAQSDPGLSPEEAPPQADRDTAAALGRRVAEHAARWVGAPLQLPTSSRHPTTKHWVFPPAERPPPPPGVERTNLRELAARPDRFEHHLMVVGTIGAAQIECVTASEPLPFAHANISDEYAIALRTGDPLLEPLRFLTLLSDPETGEDVGRIKHAAGDLVLHPHGLLHWPGRLRPPHEPFRFGPGSRRTGLSFVFCGSRPLEPAGERPLGVSEGRESDVKSYGAPVPFALRDLGSERPGLLGLIDDVRLELVVAPARVAPEAGGFVFVLDGNDAGAFAGDLFRLSPGAHVELSEGRALVVSGAEPPDPVPTSWGNVPLAPFPTFEEADRVPLPITLAGMRVEARSQTHVRVVIGQSAALVPRYWLARFLYRVALHGYRLGYLETYGGFYWDDRAPEGCRIGLRGGEHVALEAHAVGETVEGLYRAIAPEGYVERLE